MKAFAVAAAAAAACVSAKYMKYNTSAKRVEGKINVHIIPHTHDDVGWLKTVDQYYYGAFNNIQHANVQSIIDATILSLLDNPDRKFIYVEQAFFQRWWSEQSPERQSQVRGLVANGQLEFINGGWSMHDEACPSFVDMIDNTALGQRLIYEEFGVAPKTTWQIDPFGHSAFQGSMLSSPLAGYSGVYVARMDYQDINARKAYKGTEMFWAPSPSQPMQGGVLGFLPFWYYAPGGFNFGGDDNTQPIMDDPNLEDNNVDDVVSRFNALIDQQVGFTAGQDMMIMMATDFSGENAPTWFRNIDKLIHYVNLNGTYNVLYSTPSIYTAAKAANTALPLRTEDVMPYADGPHAFWSGYFTSRAALKGYVRDSSSVFQVAKQMQTITGGLSTPVDDPSNPLYLLERAMGVTQHHDAVSGTSKQAVAYDYAKRLARGRLAADAAIGSSLAQLSGYSAAPFVSCDLTNVTICPALEAGQPAIVALYNQQASARTGLHVRIPVGLPNGVASYNVFNASGNAVSAQLVPPSAVDSSIRANYYKYSGNGAPVQWLSVVTGTVPAMGYTVLFLQPSATVEEAPLTVISTEEAVASATLRGKGKKSSHKLLGSTLASTANTLSNGIVTLSFDASSGRLSSYTNAATGVTVPLTHDFLWWNASAGSSYDDKSGDNGQQSGAYIFRPNGTTPFPVTSGPVTTTFVSSGPVVWEARQSWAPWATHVVRLWAGSSTVDFEFTIGPIPFADGLGKEVIARYGTGWNTNGTWVSDSNGRDALTRVRNYRKSWNYTVIEPVAGNYVPVNLFQSTKDTASGNTMSVVTDRTQAGSSLIDGSLEFMVHRRLQVDDNRGVGEPLNETGLDGNGLIVRGIHRLSIDVPAVAGANLRAVAADSLFKPLAMYANNANGSPSAWLGAGYKASVSGLKASLPANVHIVTAQTLGPNTLLLRLAHMFGVNEDAALSQPATVNIATLFNGVKVLSAVEMTLPGTIPLTEAPVTTYTTTDGQSVTLPVIPAPPSGATLSVTLTAMQIRTFKCQVQFLGE